MMKNMDEKDTKKASIEFCRRKFPEQMEQGLFKATPRSRTISDGLTDAACIAYYLWKTEKEKLFNTIKDEINQRKENV